MTSFKRWFGAGAIVLVALALVACPALVPEPVGKITPMTFTVGDAAQTISDIDDLFTNVNDRTKYVPSSTDEGVATASITGTTLTVTPGTKVGSATVTITATLDNGKSATTSFMVTVKAAPPPPVVVPTPDPDNNQPRLIQDELPDVDDLKHGHPQTIDLRPLFTDDEGETVTFDKTTSSNPAVVDASVSGTMLTLTAAAVAIDAFPATARIDVRAEDGQHDVPVVESFHVMVVNQAPMKLTAGLSFNIGLRPGETMDPLDLTPYFSDPEGHSLTYEPSVDPSSAAMASVTGTMLTIVAGDEAGDATVTVTASDTDLMTPTVFTLRISAAPNNDPVVDMSIPNKTLELDFDDKTDTFDVMGYFSDPDGDMLNFAAVSSMADYVMASADGSMVTITALKYAADPVSVTVTASDGRGGSVDSMFDVTVTKPDVPTWKKEIPDVTFEHDGGPQTFTLAEYFNYATGYGHTSSDDTVVTTGVNDEHVLTLTRVGAGDAIVEITPSNSGGNGATQSITVMVKEAPTPPPVNMPPIEKKVGSIPAAVKVTAIAQATAVDATDDGTAQADTDLEAAEKHYPLASLIRDPDGPDADMMFSVMTSAPKVVAVYQTPADGADDTTTGNRAERGDTPTTTLDKMMVEDIEYGAADITIRGRKAGTATVTITATDDEGQEATWEIMVTVATSNTAPVVDPDITFPDATTPETDTLFGSKFVTLSTTSRLKSTATSWKEKLDLGLMFEDPDVEENKRTTGDSWTLEAFSTKTDVVTVALESTNNSAKPDEYYVKLTALKSGNAVIWFKATDSFGMSAGAKDADNAHFDVKVNDRPSTQGSQKTPWMLNDPTNTEVAKFRGMVISDEATEIRLAPADDVAADPADSPAETAAEMIARGFFSDKDYDDIRCRYVENDADGDKSVAEIAWGADAGEDRQVLSVTPERLGTMTVDVWCHDQVGTTPVDYEESDKATLTVTVTRSGSIHQ